MASGILVVLRKCMLRTYHYFNHLLTIFFLHAPSSIGFMDLCGSYTNLMVDSPINYIEVILVN